MHGGAVWLPERDLRALAEFEEVAWVEEAAPPLSPTNDGVRAATRARPLADPPYALDGRGVRLFVYDAGGVSPTHESLHPRFWQHPGDHPRRQPVNIHATHVAGTAAGDGSGSPGDRGRGIAPAAGILRRATPAPRARRFISTTTRATSRRISRSPAASYDADLATASIGSNIANNGYNCAREGDYGVSGRMLDLLVRGDCFKVRGPMIMSNT